VPVTREGSGTAGHQLRNKEGTVMSRTMQLVSLKEMAVEAYKTGADIEFDNEQGIAYLDVSRTLVMYATLPEDAS
jgi:hypothetical protein